MASTADHLRRWGPTVASAALANLAFDPFPLGLLALVALVPMLLTLREQGGKGAFKTGYVFGLLFGAGQLWWLGQFIAKWTGSVLLGVLPWLLATVLFALWFGLAGWLIGRCWARDWPWAIPIVWAGVEVLRSYIPVFAFPYGLLAHPLWPFTPLIQNAHWVTIFGISAWCMLTSVLVARVMAGDPWTRTRPYAYAVGVLLLFSILTLMRGDSVRSVPMTAVQPGVDMAFGDPARQTTQLRANLEIILRNAEINGSRLAVLPEGMARIDAPDDEIPFPFSPELPLIFGAQRSNAPRFQAAVGFDGRSFKFADKTRLVVFGEFVPLRNLLPYPPAFRLPGGDLSAGQEGVKALRVAGFTAGPLICFEALFPDIAARQSLNGAEFLPILSIDDWYLGSPAPMHLAGASVWRAVETGLPVVRSASLGVTQIVDGRGRILARAPIGRPFGLRIEVPVPRNPPRAGWLFVFPVAAAVFTLVFAFLPFRSAPQVIGQDFRRM